MSGLSCELVYSVNRLTDFGLKDSGSAQAGASILTFSAMSRPIQRPTQPPMQWIPRMLSPSLRRPELEAGHSPTYNAEIMNVQVFMVWCLSQRILHKPLGRSYTEKNQLRETGFM
jgi:hypothetical protein